MANVLGSLVVDVLANTGTFVSGMEKASLAARRSGRDIQESFSKVGNFLAPLGQVGQQISSVFESMGQAAGKAKTSFSSLGSKVSSFAAVGVGAAAGALAVGGALFEAANKAAEFGNMIYEAREKTSLTAANLSALAFISKLTGGNFDGLTTALARAEVNLTKATNSAGKTNPILFNLMGGAKGAAELGLKPMDDRLQTVLAHIFAIQDPGQRAVALNQLLGKGWMDNASALKMLAEKGYGPYIAAAQKAGEFANDKQADQAHQYTVAMAELKATLAGYAVTLGQSVIPAFIKLIGTLMTLGKAFKGLGADINVALSLTQGPGAFAAALAQDTLAWNDYTKGAADFAKQAEDMSAGFKKLADDAKAEEAEAKKQAAAHTRAAGATREHAKAVLSLAEALQRLRTKDYDEMIQGKAENVYTAMQRGLYQMGAQFKPLGATGAGPLTPFPSQFQPMGATGIGALTQMGDLFQPLQQAPKQLSALQTDFHTFFQKVADEGADFGTKLAGDFAKFTDGVANQLAKLVVTGRANWRQLFRSLEEEVISSGIKSVFAQLAKSALGGASSSAGGTPASGAAGAATGLLGLLKFIPGLQHGGEVTPGKAYIVGERHPEFFVPKQPGEVRTAVDLGRPHQTVLNFHVNGVQDFDSFKRSQAQVMSMFQNQLASAYARSR